MARVESFTRNGLRFQVHDAGPAEGPVVVLLHGFPEDSSSWDQVLPQLHAAGLRTLAFDQRGYAPEARPPRAVDYAGPELVADVLALADAAGLHRFHLVGHDWGGGVAWQVAQSAPDRLHSLTVLATPHPGAMLEASRRSVQPLLSWYMAAFQIPRLPELLLSRTMRRTLAATGLPESHARRYAARFTQPASLTGPINWYRALTRRSPVPGPDVKTAITVPTSYVWGRRDFALGRAAAETTARHVTADYRFVEADTGHWLPEVEADLVAREVVLRARPDAE
ncbi:alpha/beta hydrolase [Luteococcus peritonei]|uniref:Alpha/beta fold hydrolase n=1 Tax=Luteococcus peritonei TaxID=88874 RepID=A0ABW4RW91_9ACTN